MRSDLEVEADKYFNSIGTSVLESDKDRALWNGERSVRKCLFHNIFLFQVSK